MAATMSFVTRLLLVSGPCGNMRFRGRQRHDEAQKRPDFLSLLSRLPPAPASFIFAGFFRCKDDCGVRSGSAGLVRVCSFLGIPVLEMS